VNRYKYLGIHFCASGSFNFAQEELYKKALKVYFKFSKDLLSLNPIRQFTGLSFSNTASPEDCKYFGRSLIKNIKEIGFQIITLFNTYFNKKTI
jgi:hypothetical protein